MKNRIVLSLAAVSLLLLAAPISIAQQAQAAAAGPASANRTDIYQVYMVKAAPGKTAEFLKSLTVPAAGTPMPTHTLILRHLDGDDWDFCVIQHVGTKYTLDASTPISGPERELRAWHLDTFAQGPSWAEFSKAMGIGQAAAGAAPAGKDVYTVSDYRGAPGHRDQLEDTLKKVAASSARPADNVLLQHRDGSAWDFLHITRYDGFQDYAAQQEDPQADARARRVGLTNPGLDLRQHLASHHDTIANRIAVEAAK